MKKKVIVLLALGIILCGCSNTSQEKTNTTNENTETGTTDKKKDAPSNENTEIPIVITIGESKIPAVLNDTIPAQEFAQTLPQTIDMNRTQDREFYGYIDEELTVIEEQVTTFDNGDIAFWIRGNGIAVFYDNSVNSQMSSPIIIIGKMDSSYELLKDLSDETVMTFSLQ